MLVSRIAFSGLAAVLATLATSCAGDKADDNGVEVVAADVQDVSLPLRELVKLPLDPPEQSRAREAEPVRRIPNMLRSTDRARQADPVVQNVFGEGLIPSPTVSFEG